MAHTVESGVAKNLTASGAVSLTGGDLLGFYVNSTSAGTIVIRDGTTSSGTAISGTITPAIGFHRYPADCNTGCYATLGGTIDVTFFFSAG
jgi:hypothetical protein